MFLFFILFNEDNSVVPITSVWFEAKQAEKAEMCYPGACLISDLCRSAEREKSVLVGYALSKCQPQETCLKCSRALPSIKLPRWSAREPLFNSTCAEMLTLVQEYTARQRENQVSLWRRGRAGWWRNVKGEDADAGRLIIDTMGIKQMFYKT